MAPPKRKSEQRRSETQLPTSTTGNVRVIYKPTGEALERTLPRTTMVMSQTFRAFNLPTLQPQDPCGDFLDALINIVLEHPAYLSVEDCPRYASLIQAFSEFSTTLTGKTAAVVAKMSLNKLSLALAFWIDRNIVNPDVHPLMSSYALDAAHLIEVHAYGELQYTAAPPWEVKAMVDFDPQDVPSFRRGVKRDITQRLQGLLVRVQVPPRACFEPVSTRFGAPLTGPCNVYATLLRCHLSESVYNLRHFKLTGAPRPTLDLMGDFKFAAELVSTEEVEAHLCRRLPSVAVWDPRLRLELPGSWITACLDDSSMQWKPVPAWAGPDTPKYP